MKITEKNIQKVSDRVYNLRQHWRRRVKIKNVVHQVASSVFFVLSIVCAYSLLDIILLDEAQGKGYGLLTMLLGVYGISFLSAVIAAVIIACRCKKEPRSKAKGFKYSEINSMVTGIKIYQERISPLEQFHGRLNNILSLAFALLLTGMVAYFYAIRGLFEAHWESFLGWAIFGTIFSGLVHRLLLGLLSFPVSLLYCFGAPAPGLKRALEKKAEELKPTYKYVDRPKSTVSKSSEPAVWGADDYARINKRAEEILRRGSSASDVWVPSKEDIYEPLDVHVDVSDM